MNNAVQKWLRENGVQEVRLTDPKLNAYQLSCDHENVAFVVVQPGTDQETARYMNGAILVL